MNTKKTTIKIPEKLFEALQKQVEDSNEYETINDFVIYLLKQYISIEDIQDTSEEEKEEIEKRLKKLGYL